MIQSKLNLFWGTTAKSIQIDIAKHTIEFIISYENSGVVKEHSLIFKKVESFYFDYYNEKSIIADYRVNKAKAEIQNWEIIDIAEIHFIPEMKKINDDTKKLISVTTDYNFIIEIYSSSLFINSKEVYIDNERIF